MIGSVCRKALIKKNIEEIAIWESNQEKKRRVIGFEISENQRAIDGRLYVYVYILYYSIMQPWTCICEYYVLCLYTLTL